MKTTVSVLICLFALTLATWAATNAPPKAAAPAPATNAPSVFTRGFDNFTGLFKNQVAKDMAAEFYAANTLDLNLAGTYTAAGGSGFQDLWTSKFKKGTWGVNIGSMFWISKYIGTGVDLGVTDINNPGSYLFDYGGIDAAVRYPIGRVAPYIVGTAGRNFDAPNWYYGVGPGVSFAITPRAKLFTEARFIWQENTAVSAKSDSQTGLRAIAGLTISF